MQIDPRSVCLVRQQLYLLYWYCSSFILSFFSLYFIIFLSSCFICFLCFMLMVRMLSMLMLMLLCPISLKLSLHFSYILNNCQQFILWLKSVKCRQNSNIFRLIIITIAMIIISNFPQIIRHFPFAYHY